MYESKLLKQKAWKELSEVKMNKWTMKSTVGKQGTVMTGHKNDLNISGI
jgi:hypothetical protein